jgi:agmatine deiminase
VDDITRFVSPDTVVTAVESDPDDPNYEPLRDYIRRLRAATDQDGKALAIIELPMPGPVVFEGCRLPASYANFYIANGIVLVPPASSAASSTWRPTPNTSAQPA